MSAPPLAIEQSSGRARTPSKLSALAAERASVQRYATLGLTMEVRSGSGIARLWAHHSRAVCGRITLSSFATLTTDANGAGTSNSEFPERPAAAAGGVPNSPTLTSSAADATSYDVTIGTTTPPSLVVTGQATASYAPTLAAGITYFWQIGAHNAGGATAGSIWSFTTAAAPQPPPPPSRPPPRPAPPASVRRPL